MSKGSRTIAWNFHFSVKPNPRLHPTTQQVENMIHLTAHIAILEFVHSVRRDDKNQSGPDSRAYGRDEKELHAR